MACRPGKPNVVLRLTTEEVARGIVEQETLNGRREQFSYGVLDPSNFAVTSGPAIMQMLATCQSWSMIVKVTGCSRATLAKLAKRELHELLQWRAEM